jgi:transposase
MKGMAADIRHCLQFQKAPVTARQIAEEIATAADTWEVRNALTTMVHAGKVKRHHNPDGILTYSLAEDEAGRLGDVEQDEEVQPESKGKGGPRKKAAPLQDKLLEILGDGEMTAAELTEASRGLLSSSQVGNLLYILRVGGRVVKVGTYRNARWRRADRPGATSPEVAVVPALYQITVTASSQRDFDSLVALLTLISKMSGSIALKRASA